MATQTKNNAKICDVSTLIKAGFDPKTGLPIKYSNEGNGTSALKEGVKRALRIVDEQDFVNRYKWYNLPEGLNGQMLERILYYKGQCCFFYCEELNKFYFLPYALDGTIDMYGRFLSVRPVPIAASQDIEKLQGPVKTWLNTKTLRVAYDIVLPEDLKVETLTNSAVILNDYTPQLSETIISRQIINDPILDVMANCIPFMNTALINATGVQGMRVGSQDEQSNVTAASRSINNAALNGEKYIPVVGTLDFQDLTAGNVGKAEEFLLAMQSLDNFRLSLLGIDNGGLFQKKAHMLAAEQATNNSPVGLILEDGLAQRQRFCNIINSIWGIGIWCEISEQLQGDVNADGMIADDHTMESGNATEAAAQTENAGGTEND